MPVPILRLSVPQHMQIFLILHGAHLVVSLHAGGTRISLHARGTLVSLHACGMPNSRTRVAPYGRARMMPSKATCAPVSICVHIMRIRRLTSAMAFAGNALSAPGTKPLKKPLHPRSCQTACAASLQWKKRRPAPSSSVMIRCLTTSDGYAVSQNTCADSPPAQKFTAGADSDVCLTRASVIKSYDDHQKKKNDRKISVAASPWLVSLCQQPVRFCDWDLRYELESAYAVLSEQLMRAVDRAAVLPLGLVRRVLHLKPRLDVLYRGRDEGHFCAASQQSPSDATGRETDRSRPP